MENKKKGIVSKDTLLAYGVQFGHKAQNWNPAMKPFIYGLKDKTHIINLNRTLASLQIAYDTTKKITAGGGTFLFVGTNKQSSETIKLNSERVGVFYVNHRWLGGTLTNFKTIKNSVKKLRDLERLANSGYAGYTKKEAAKFQRILNKLDKSLGGIKFMRTLPDAIFVTSAKDEEIAIKEANKLSIPVIGIVDTDSNPRSVRFPIFANDDANKSVSLITTIIADAISAGKGMDNKQLIVGVEEEKLQVLGVIKKTLINNSNSNNTSDNKTEITNDETKFNNSDEQLKNSANVENIIIKSEEFNKKSAISQETIQKTPDYN